MTEGSPSTRTGEREPVRSTGVPLEEPSLRLARRVALAGFGPVGARGFTVRYWNGFTEPGGLAGRPSPTIVVQHPGALRAAFLPPSELAFCETFLSGDVEVEGNLEAAVDSARRLGHRLWSPRIMARLAALSVRLPPRKDGVAARRRRWIPARRHSRTRDAAAIRHHYDVGNEFYRLWLDAQTVYSSAYFSPGVRDLDEAQEDKLDYVCRKLRLRPNERLLDIGCGWGGLIRHAARRYGADATGITLSPAQEALTTRRISEEGLEQHCRAEIRDYRDLPDRPAFDKVSSVGMFEHVGRSHLLAYFKAASRVLRPGGLLLNSGIIDLEAARLTSLPVRVGRWLQREGEFLQRYIFPDGELLPLAEVIRAAEKAGFETRDVESLREHYLLTLRHWGNRLQARRREAIALVGETTFRAWRLYLAASANAFATGRIGLVQILFAKPRPDGSTDAPLTREDLYAEGAAASGRGLGGRRRVVLPRDSRAGEIHEGAPAIVRAPDAHP